MVEPETKGEDDLNIDVRNKSYQKGMLLCKGPKTQNKEADREKNKKQDS